MHAVYQAVRYPPPDVRALLDRIPEFHTRAPMCRQAPVAVVVCADRSREKYAGNWPSDCGAATQNLLLALHGSGLGAVWCGLHPREERVTGMRALLKLPENVIPFSLVVLGWPTEEKASPERFDPKRIHTNGW